MTHNNLPRAGRDIALVAPYFNSRSWYEVRFFHVKQVLPRRRSGIIANDATRELGELGFSMEQCRVLASQQTELDIQLQ